MKVGYCCLYGLTNAGKSTLLNNILGFKLQAVSKTKQTTRENVQGIYEDEDSQIIFIDTPGIHSPHKLLGQKMVQQAKQARYGVDVIVYVVDATRRVNEVMCDDLKKIGVPIIVAFNKIDIADFEKGQLHLQAYKQLLPDADFIEISALKKFNIEDLIKLIKSHLLEGEKIYVDDVVSDHPMRFFYSEKIREACLKKLQEEVPHSINVEIMKIEEGETDLKIYADIIVERSSEKSIVIGKRGQMIGEIRRMSQREIERFTGKQCDLELFVKVEKDWRDSSSRLKEYGYN